MNIAQIKQIGIIDSWVDLQGQITEIKETKERTQKNRLMSKVRIKDTTGDIGAWIYVDVQPCSLNQNIVARGMLKEYNSNRYLDYVAVKESQQAFQNAPQTPQNAPQSTNNKKDVDWDAIAKGKVRCQVLCAMLQGGISVDYPEVLRHTDFIMLGIDPDSVPNPHPDITENQYGYNPNKDDIPF